MDYRDYFRGKRITVMGLGLIGRGIAVTRFLAECGADLTVTDLKTEEQLREALEKLSDLSGITYVLGEHRLEDFRDKDMIIKASGVPQDSRYIEEARKNEIPIKMDAALFLELAPPVLSIGVTGTRGKSTVTHAIYDSLRAIKTEANLKDKTSDNEWNRNIFLGGNVRGIATLPLLKEVKENDIIVLELDSWSLQGFEEVKISPNIAVFTTFFEDHLTYYSSMEDYFADKATIFNYQKPGDFTVFGTQMSTLVKQYGQKLPLSYTVIGEEDIPEEWELSIAGEHNRYNMACAVAVLDHMGVEEKVIQKHIESFTGVPGRLEFLGEKDGVKIYNDNNATTPTATLAGLKAVGEENNVVLIIGGTDKGITMAPLIESIPEYCKAVVLYPGSGTDGIRSTLKAMDDLIVRDGENLKDCVNQAWELCESGDVLLFSPAFSSFGKEYKNEYDRNDQFVELVKQLS